VTDAAVPSRRPCSTAEEPRRAAAPARRLALGAFLDDTVSGNLNATVDVSGLVTVLGFAVAASLSALS
jgi:hypothetical protein